MHVPLHSHTQSFTTDHVPPSSTSSTFILPHWHALLPSGCSLLVLTSLSSPNASSLMKLSLDPHLRFALADSDVPTVFCTTDAGCTSSPERDGKEGEYSPMGHGHTAILSQQNLNSVDILSTCCMYTDAHTWACTFFKPPGLGFSSHHGHSCGSWLPEPLLYRPRSVRTFVTMLILLDYNSLCVLSVLPTRLPAP